SPLYAGERGTDCPLPPAAAAANLIARSPASEPARGTPMNRVAVMLLCLVGLTPPAAQAQARRPMQTEDLFRFKRVADPQISPDGRTVAYALTTVDPENNRSSSNLWLAPADGTGEPRQLTATPKKDRHPR